ncbi:hypothetical protein EX895_004662 [Sporisorium graminicola]|uniref:AB hydrolase-1 domain-containing protein n=1 Tax=Sporisorium graminicola TaxID=280036 RepID=A0A4U7KQF6_9BASI|nr:hypothetical protein EX895_004662 [Sporisorium graminicola]TKY86513.1 hypothetical protein EX895_004662 [Sporisorium graminicola]
MTAKSAFPSPLAGSLQLFQGKPVELSYFDSDPQLAHSLIFLPGLTDTIGGLPYLPRLAERLRKHGFSLVQPQLTCHLGGYGQCTLEGDAQEIANCVAHLRSLPSKRKGKVVLMGHSTGCQEVIAYLLSSTRATSALTRIDGGILQAPVSDREFYEKTRNEASEQERNEMDRELQHATQLVQAGQGATLMPRKDTATSTLPTDPEDPPNGSASSAATESGNTTAVLSLAMTAYRTWSLKAKGGHDDFFSSDLDDALIRTNTPGSRSMGRAIKNLQAGADPETKDTPRILALIGEKDEYVPDGYQAVLLKRWTELLEATGGFQATILKDADHRADGQVATDHLLQLVDTFLANIS